MKAELAKLFGNDVDFDVGADTECTECPTNSPALVIAMAVLLALSLAVLIAAIVIVIR